MFGWRKRIGVISPTVMEVTPYDFYRLNLEGIGLVGVTCDIDDFKSSEFDKALSQVDKSCDYLASRHVDFIIHMGAPIVVNKGEKKFDQTLIKRIEERTGIPATTSIGSAIRGLEHLNLNKIAVVSPYPDELHESIVSYIEDYGFSVIASANYRSAFKQLQDIHTQTIYKLVVDVVKKEPEVEGVYIPCPQWPAAEIVNILEKDLRIPVIAGDPADFWSALYKLGISDKIVGHGKLLASLHQS